MANLETQKGANGWDEFVSRANEFIESGELEERENRYKREMACRLGKAISALFDRNEELA